MTQTLVIAQQPPQSATEDAPKIQVKQPVVDAVQVERLYATHYAALKTFLMRRTNSEELVEVLLQEVYLRLMDIEDLSVINQPQAYLTRMAYHLLVDHRRRELREEKYFATDHIEDIEGWEFAESAPPIPDQIHYAQIWADYDKLLRELPPPTREVLLSYKLEGLTHGEIAKKFNISKSWVEKLVAKALLYCREHGPEIDF